MGIPPLTWGVHFFLQLFFSFAKQDEERQENRIQLRFAVSPKILIFTR